MEVEFKKEQIVWAKVNGYPWWPGYIRAVLRGDLFEVVFFGDFSHAELQSCKIKEFQGCADNFDRRNKKLLAAAAVADRILRGESSVARESECLLNASRLSANHYRSQRKDGESSEGEEDSGASLKPKPSPGKGLRSTRRGSQVIECNAAALDPSGDFNSKMSIERLKSTVGANDQAKLEAVPLKKYTSLKPSPADASLAELRRLRTLKSLKQDRTEFEQILSQEEQKEPSTTPQAPQNPPDAGRTAAEPPLADPGAQLSRFDDNVAQTLALLRSEHPRPERIAQQLLDLEQLVNDPALRIWDAFGRKLGSSLSLIAFLSLERTRDSESYAPALDSLNGLMTRIKRALCEAFFRVEDDMLDCITLKPQMSHLDDPSEPLPSLNRNLSSNSIYRPGEKNLKSIFCKNSKNNNSKLMDKRALLEKEELPGNGEARNGPAAWEADPRVVFRVCKKIAKLIYLNGGKNTIRKQTCEDLANKIEEFVRKNSQNLPEYKLKVVALFQKIEKRPEIVQSSFIKNCKGNNLELLFDQVHTFINN